MQILRMVLIFLIITLTPRLMILLCDRVRVFRTLGRVFLCYAAGFAFSFLLSDTSFAMDMAEILIPIAIPLVLFSADYRSMRRLARPAARSFFLMILSVALVSCAAYFLFGGLLKGADALSGMAVGLYTGGTPNLMAIGMALHVGDETIVLANTVDQVVGGIYFFLLITVMPALSRRMLPNRDTETGKGVQTLEADYSERARKASLPQLKRLIPVLLLGVASLAIAAGTALLITGTLDTLIIMLLVTTCGIGFSFIPRVRRTQGTYAAGQYLICMFSVGIGMSFDLSGIGPGVGYLLLFFAFVQFGAVLLHFLLARLCRIDGPTAVITSTAGIYGPAFIGPVANALQNREVILPGLLCGVLGYALGNYLGIGIALLLRLFS